MQKLSELLAKARVVKTGAVLLAGIAVDGHYPGSPIRVVTHAHSDHMIGLRESIRETPLIAATPLTHEFMAELGYRVPSWKRLDLQYGVRIRVEDSTLELKPANHIPGAAQVLVETGDGLRLGYTGDFKQPGTPVMRDLDVLVMEATYGRPEYRRPWSSEIEQLFADLVTDLLSRGPVYIYGFHGKLQEAMRILREYGVDAPFIAPDRVYRMAVIARKYGVRVGTVLRDGSREAAEVKRSGWYVYFKHAMSKSVNGDPRASHVLLTGWEFNGPYRRLDERRWVVSLSDHADFEQLVEYVLEARPRLLVVDDYREGAGEYFASYVRRRLGIPAVATP